MILDSIDWKIIKQLHLDARKSFKELGKTIGYTGLGAKKRVIKLVKQQVIQPSVLINTEALGFRLAFILLEIESAEAMRKMIERYKNCPRILNFFTTLGGYNLIVLVMAEDQDTLQSEAMEMCSVRSCEGIRRSEFYPLNEVNMPFLPLRRYTSIKQEEIAPCGVDCKVCTSFQNQECVACPSVKEYKGPLK